MGKMARMDKKRASLSQSILEMKFMKRTKDKLEKQQFQEEGEQYFSGEITTRMKKESGKFIIEPSYVFCEQLRNGRVSYQGMNPLIEKLMQADEDSKRAQEEAKKEKKKNTDVSDEEMAVQWQKIRGKFDAQKGRRFQRETFSEDKPLKKKLKFLKPVD